MSQNKKFAVVLSGCGFLDGAEIRESVLTLLALDTLKVSYEIFAPNKPQHHVVNHAAGEETSATRNVLEESARIARGNVKDITELNHENFDGLVIPGGFGVAKNLCTFAFDGPSASVDTNVKEIISSFHGTSKPITAICIAPALVALCLKGVNLTIGTDEATAGALESMGAKHTNKSSSEFLVDDKNKIVSTPAYMHDNASLDEIYMGISGAIKAQLEMA